MYIYGHFPYIEGHSDLGCYRHFYSDVLILNSVSKLHLTIIHLYTVEVLPALLFLFLSLWASVHQLTSTEISLC